MGTVNDIITLANAQLGNGGSRYWNWYTDNVNPSQGYYVDGDTTPYCAEYISWLLAQTHTRCVHFPSSVAFDRTDIFPTDRIQKSFMAVGDIVAFDWDNDEGGDHVGLVTAVYEWGVNTIEGNTGGGLVKERSRDWSTILFGVRPNYSEGDTEVITDDDVDKIARRCAEYVYGDYDKQHNLNMYNTVHWSHTYLEWIYDLVKKIAKKLGV